VNKEKTKMEPKLDNITKEELEQVQKDPILSKIYKSMEAGLTKKFQDLSTTQKEMESKLTKLEADLKESNGYVDRWEDWYYRNISIPDINVGASGDEGNSGATSGKRTKSKQSSDEIGVADLVSGLQQLADAFNRARSKYDNMFDLVLQLNDMYRTHPDMDAKKVLSLAAEKGYSNLSDAYDSAYRDTIIKTEAEKIADERLKAERAKASTVVEPGSNSYPSHLQVPKDAPKTFSEGTRQFLDELKSGKVEGSKTPPPATTETTK
jgi:hypothetical protein